MIHRDPPHYLKTLTSRGTPRRLLWLDCHGHGQQEAGLHVDRFDAGALGRTWWTSKRAVQRDELHAHDEPAELWRQASEFCRPGRRTVLFAHDLAYQLRISQALVWLPALGWRLDKIVLERQAAWCSLRQGNRTLLCCDLKSWAPVELEYLAADLSAGKRDSNGHPAGRAFRAAVCAARCNTIRDAALQIFAWVEGENLGPFRPTGSGQSYAAFRRRFLTEKILVHDDVARLQVEREAMWTGRCEAWRHGRLAGGPFVEYDMSAAYCRIAAECELPTVAGATMRKPSLEQLLKACERDCVLAEVEITTDVATVPVGGGSRTVWPVGTFTTTLWDPEWQLAAEYASSFRCLRAWRYRRGPALQAFAGFVLDGMGDQTQAYGLVPSRVLKHWSRCLVGRLGLRYRRWERFGTSDEPDLRLVTFIDADEGTSTDLLCAGHDRLLLTEMVEGLDSLPQIPGWVMSECRRRLFDAMLAVGLDNVVYVDTDSIVVDGAEPFATIARLGNGSGGRWARKGTYRKMTIHGPRNLSVEDSRRVAGVPLTARQQAPLEFTGQVMRSIKESMRAGELDCVASIPRTFRLDAPDLRRQHLSGGRTAPYRLDRETR